MATRWFSNWREANTYQDQLAYQDGQAYSVYVPLALAHVAGDDVQHIVVTTDKSLVEQLRASGGHVGIIQGE